MGSVRTVKSWVELPTRVASVRQRKAVIRNWVVGNQFLGEVPDTHSLSEGEKVKVWQNVYEASEKGVSALRKGTIDIYQTINAMINAMQDRGAAASTIFGHKFKLVKLFRYLKLRIDEDDLKQAVRPIDSSRVTDDKQPTREQIRNCILHGTTKQKAMISFMVSTGARIGETVQVKLSDIEFDKKPVIVRFPARKTKTARKRYSFLSSECVDLLKAYTADRERKSEWLFDGWIPTEKRDNQKDKHLTTSSAYLQIRSVFEHPSVNLIPPGARSNNHKTGPDFGPHQSYHPHVFRGTNLTITKSTGFPDSYAEFLVGHSTGSKEHYYNEDELGKLWLEKCEPNFCFLTTKSAEELQSNMLEFKAKIAKDTYKTLIETGALKPETLTTPVLEVIAKKLGIKFETLVLGGTMVAQDYDTFHKFEPGEYQELLKLPLEERRKKFLDLRPYPKAEVETRLRLQLFDMVSNAIGLDTQVYNKYYEAIRVLRENTAQSSWENHTDYYLRVEVGSDAYMQALADGFKVIDSDGKMRILQKPKSPPPPLNNDEHGKTGLRI
jgi:integrase